MEEIEVIFYRIMRLTLRNSFNFLDPIEAMLLYFGKKTLQKVYTLSSS
jgi:hypothetical protein